MIDPGPETERLCFVLLTPAESKTGDINMIQKKKKIGL
jgi:hypothetical protein